MTEYDSNKISGGVSKSTNYRIDIDINQVEFSYHHLFSFEHVLAYKLTNMYKYYKTIEEGNLIQILTEKVCMIIEI